MMHFSLGALVDFNELSFHNLMLSNSEKYIAFSNALRPIVRDRIVVEVGAGVGVLSLIAASLGAKRVLAIEQSELPLKVMKALLLDYADLSGKIEVLEGSHRDFANSIRIGEVIFSETIGYLGFEEGISIILSDVHKWAPRSKIIPLSMEIEFHPQTVCLPGIAAPLYLSNEPVERFRAVAITPTLNFEPLHSIGRLPEMRSAWTVQRDMVLKGFTTSFTCKIAGSVSITNYANPNWPRATIQFPEPVTVRQNEVFEIQLTLTDFGRLDVQYGRTSALRQTQINLSPKTTEMIGVPSQEHSLASIQQKAREILDLVGSRT